MELGAGSLRTTYSKTKSCSGSLEENLDSTISVYQNNGIRLPNQ